MNTNDAQTVLGLFGVSPSAIVHASDTLVRGLFPSATKEGLCHSLPIGQAEQVVTGVKFFDSILPGEVVR